MNNIQDRSNVEFLLFCHRLVDEAKRDKEEEKRLEELFFQEMMDEIFCDDEERDETKHSQMEKTI